MKKPFKMKGWSGFSPLKQNEHNPIKPKERSERVYVSEEDAKHPTMSDKPMYEGQDRSSHLMGDDGKKTAWPTLFHVDGVWHDTSRENTERQMEIAKQQGELYTFDTNEQMVNFARKGNWKKYMK